jgi:divalent metal cation (Fe/Co/Zn/Cd) transporter
MRTFWLYTLARLGIIVGVGLILFPFLGLNLLMAVASIVIGALLSYLFLGNMRARVATDIEARLAARASKPKRKSADEAAEDQIVDDRLTEEERLTEEVHAADEKRTADEENLSDGNGREK